MDQAGQTRQCPNCGAANSIDSALCENCRAPLTAYAGQLTGQGESAQGRLAGQVAQLETRPPGVVAMTVFDVLFAGFWPLRSVAGAFLAKPRLNAEGTNYLGAAFGTVGPVLAAIVLIPLALALFGLAWMTWTQRPWTWTANLAALGLFALLALLHFSPLSVVWLAAAGALAYLWFRPETKAWFGFSG
jgi:hypothetical protein